MRKGCSNAQIHDDHHMASDLGTNSSFFFFLLFLKRSLFTFRSLSGSGRKRGGRGRGIRGKGNS